MCDFRDPTTVGARVFIGNVAENTTREDVTKHFEKYGTIVGILLQRQFCFIQFEKDESAQAAIKACHYSIFMDRKITVRSATNNPAERKRTPYLGNGNTVGANLANAKNPNADLDKRKGFQWFFLIITSSQ
jgi:RNA recognition motif-containing protein